MKGNQEGSANTDRGAWGALGRDRKFAEANRGMGGLALFVAAAALALAACSGGQASSPHVASLGNSPGSSSTDSAPAQPTGNPTKLLDEWAACIRKHGAPNQSDPTIDSNKDIQITMINVSTALEHEVHGSTGPCSNYLLAAENALRGGQPPPIDNPAQDVRFAECMRANGVPGFPDPVNGTTNFAGTGVNMDSPAFNNATKLCDHKVGATYYPPGKEIPGVVIETGCSGPPGMQCKLPPDNGGSGNRPRPVSSGTPGSGGNG